jgi:hypothetical protein
MKLIWNEKDETFIWEDGTEIAYDDFPLARELARRYNIHGQLVEALDVLTKWAAHQTGQTPDAYKDVVGPIGTACSVLASAKESR